MAIRPASRKDAQVLVGGYDCTPALDAVGFKEVAGLATFNPLGPTGVFPVIYDTGARSAELTAAGLLDGNNTTLSTITGTSAVAMVKFDSDVLNRNAYCFRSATVSETEVLIADGDMTRIVPGISVSGEFNQGYIVAPLIARTDGSNTDATYADAEAATISPTGAHAFLNVTAIALGGYANCLITVRDSADGGAHADHTAFTAVTAIGAEYKYMAHPVGRYISVSWAWVGGAPSGGHSITFSVAYARD